jgi:hypothetical protein
MPPWPLSIAWSSFILLQTTWYLHISSPGLISMNDMVLSIASTWHSSATLALFALHRCLGPSAQSPFLTLHHLDSPSCPKLLACPSHLHMVLRSQALPWSSLSFHIRLCVVSHIQYAPSLDHHLIKSSSLIDKTCITCKHAISPLVKLCSPHTKPR